MSDTYASSNDIGAELMPPCTVLLVDDDPQVLDVIGEMLSRLGCVVIKTGSPDRVLQILKNLTLRLDLLVTDFMMKEMNGSELARTAFRLQPRLRALFISGDPTCVTRFRGDDHFLLKPFTTAELKTKLSQVLRDLPVAPDSGGLSLGLWRDRETQVRLAASAGPTLSE
jgi:CheY-like chemotaxis protein